jgi:DNA-damage-inducible protein J
MAQINIRIDDALKDQGEHLFRSLGLSFSSAVSMFVSQSVREGGIPFAVTTRQDPFFSENNMKRLRCAIADKHEVKKTFADLKAMEDE